MSLTVELPPVMPPLPPDPGPLPFRVEPDGTARMGSSRVLLVLVVRAWLDGDTPEGIVQRYDSADLADVYAAVAYYLRHRAAVDAYVAAWEAAGEVIRRKIEARQGVQVGLRERSLAKRPQRPWVRPEQASISGRPEFQRRRPPWFPASGTRGRRRPRAGHHCRWRVRYGPPRVRRRRRPRAAHTRPPHGPDFAYDRVGRGLAMPGVLLVHDWLGIGLAVENLLLVAGCMEPDELADRVVYVPL